MSQGKASQKANSQKTQAAEGVKELTAKAADSKAKKTTVTDKAAVKSKAAEDQHTKIFEERLSKHHDELRWLYMELYENDSMFAELCDHMYQFYLERNEELKKLDIDREKDKEWYKKNDLLGMMFYIDNFAGNMKGVQSKLDYIERQV